MKPFMTRALVVGSLVSGLSIVGAAQEPNAHVMANVRGGKSCNLRTLRGSYLFAASGFNVVAGVPQPKAIQEVIDFNGDGTLTVPEVSLSVNGVVSHPPGGPGDYTLDESCRGAIVFTGGPSFDIVVATNGRRVWMFQTNPNTVFQGTATRLVR